MEQTVRQLQGDIPLEQQIIRNKIRSADKIQDHFSEQILERTQRVIFNIENHSLSPFQYLFGKMILNFISRPDFISYNLLFQRDISLKLAHGLFHAPCAAWVLRSEKELEQCQKQFCMYIFENFLPKQK